MGETGVSRENGETRGGCGRHRTGPSDVLGEWGRLRTADGSHTRKGCSRGAPGTLGQKVLCRRVVEVRLCPGSSTDSRLKDLDQKVPHPHPLQSIPTRRRLPGETEETYGPDHPEPFAGVSRGHRHTPAEAETGGRTWKSCCVRTGTKDPTVHPRGLGPDVSTTGA